VVAEDGELLLLEDLLPSPDAGPEAVYARNVLLEELDAALDELPKSNAKYSSPTNSRATASKRSAAATGLSVNTLLSRKHYAVLRLRERLQGIHEEFAKT